jgi:cell division protein FtsQ
LIWEDEAPAESRIRRMQQVTPASDRTPSARAGAARSGAGRLGPVAAQFPDDDGGDLPLPGRERYDDAPPRPWWRPASTFGRVALSLAALIVVGGVATCVYLLQQFLEHDARFRIESSADIAAAGLAEVSRAEMLPVFGEDIGRNIFFVPLAERRKQLEQIPWIESATVMRFLPDQIRVIATERKPIAFARSGSEIGLVDANGVLLAMPAAMMAQHHYSFPVVTGIDARDPLPGRKARMEVYQRLLSELDSGGQHLSAQISEIDLTDPEDARVLMPAPGADILAHFGEDNFLARYQRYKAHIAEWRQQYPRLAEVDLRYDAQVVLKMGPGAGEAQPAATAAATASGAAPTPAAKPAPGEPMASAAADAQPQPAATSSASRLAAKRREAAARAARKRAEAHRAAMHKASTHTSATQEQ